MSTSKPLHHAICNLYLSVQPLWTNKWTAGCHSNCVPDARPLWSLDSGLFLVRSSADQLRVAYDALDAWLFNWKS